MVNYLVGPSTVNPYLVQWVQSGFGRDENVERKCTDEGRQLVITAHITFSPIRYKLGTKLNPRIIKFKFFFY